MTEKTLKTIQYRGCTIEVLKEEDDSWRPRTHYKWSRKKIPPAISPTYRTVVHGKYGSAELRSRDHYQSAVKLARHYIDNDEEVRL
jgi:hypothetical protein